ncbi:helix-turn-helix domain-containing protein [Cetobacterium somerae]|uniref:XRE family transcriptional regulator n=1 Tax=Cetobacterium somerae TaxID=188913 RepID=UPI00211E1BD4|nr:LexA family transcriptional regulator [Cetobacterium somerae]MCQ9627808.1 helix-turn-helix domain-containing protein [Cetobacterium somerae]
MEPLSIVLKKLRESKSLTIEELARRANIGKGTVGDIETGRSNSTAKTLTKISKALNLSEHENSLLFNSFLQIEHIKPKKMSEIDFKFKNLIPVEKKENLHKNKLQLQYYEFNNSNFERIDLMSIPVYSSVAAGCGYIPDSEPVEYVYIPKISGECIGAKVNGDSMEPTLYQGDIVVIKKDIEVGLGEIGVFMNKTTGESLVKRLKKKNGIFILESDNHIFRDIEIKSDEICCCGKVINIIKKDLKKKVNHLQELIDDIPPSKIKLAEKLLKTLISDDDE